MLKPFISAAVLFLVSVGMGAVETPLTPMAVSATSAQYPAANLLTRAGLTETSPGSEVYQLSNNLYVFDQATQSVVTTQWNSGYLAFGADTNALVDFDLGSVKELGGFRVWNFNDKSPGSDYTFRGFKNVSIYTSDNGTFWTGLAQQFIFARASGEPTYLGEMLSFHGPVRARFIRFLANSTYQNGGARELAGLGKVRFFGRTDSTITVPAWPLSTGIIPADAGGANVQSYGAIGDGVTDDTSAIQRAIDAVQGTNIPVLFPKGTYLVSRTLQIRKSRKLLDQSGYDYGRTFGFTTLRGLSPEASRIVLADRTFADSATLQPIISCGFQGDDSRVYSADWFNINVSDLTIDLGSENPGAIGINFYTNNWGSLRRVIVQSSDNPGGIGIDLASTGLNGPLLVQDCTVFGCRIGLRTGGGQVNSATIERCTFVQQTEVAVLNQGQAVSLSEIEVYGDVQAFRNEYGLMTISNCEVNSESGTAEVPAIFNGDGLTVLSLKAQGFDPVIRNESIGGSPDTTRDDIRIWTSHPIQSLFPKRNSNVCRIKGIVPAAPGGVLPAVDTWVNVRSYRLMSDIDDAAAFQRAIDSGAQVVYIPITGALLQVGTSIELRSKELMKIAGLHNRISFYGTQASGLVVPTGKTNESDLVIDQLGNLKIDGGNTRTLTIRDCSGTVSLGTGVKTYFDNVTIAPLTVGIGQTVCAHQMNIEGIGPKLTNNGGTIRILGLKTEGQRDSNISVTPDGPVLIISLGATSEIIGGLCYTIQSGFARPMFINRGGKLFVSLVEVCYNGDPYRTIVEETRNNVTRLLTRSGVPGGNLSAPLSGPGTGSMVTYFASAP